MAVYLSVEVFQILWEAGILPEECVLVLTGVGRFRNILAHVYITIELDKVYENLQKAQNRSVNLCGSFSTLLKNRGRSKISRKRRA